MEIKKFEYLLNEKSFLDETIVLIIIFLFHHLVKKWQALNLQFWSFGPNLPKKGILGQKTEKVNITIELNIFELVHVPNFTLNK